MRAVAASWGLLTFKGQGHGDGGRDRACALLQRLGAILIVSLTLALKWCAGRWHIGRRLHVWGSAEFLPSNNVLCTSTA